MQRSGALHKSRDIGVVKVQKGGGVHQSRTLASLKRRLLVQNRVSFDLSSGASFEEVKSDDKQPRWGPKSRHESYHT